jgi:hypothetical protein
MGLGGAMARPRYPVTLAAQPRDWLLGRAMTSMRCTPGTGVLVTFWRHRQVFLANLTLPVLVPLCGY